jgi:hypothetical protein
MTLKLMTHKVHMEEEEEEKGDRIAIKMYSSPENSVRWMNVALRVQLSVGGSPRPFFKPGNLFEDQPSLPNSRKKMDLR